MTKLIKNKQDWNKYKEFQDNRVHPLESRHNPDGPLRYPCFVITGLLSSGHTYLINHTFIYKEDALELIKCK